MKPALQSSRDRQLAGICNPPARKRGFALVVTLSLMILLAVISVGLLGLATIELRATSAGEDQAVARANARLAMMLALGDLQKASGPDQRVTARADILDTTDPSKAKWTGAWNVDPAAGTTPPPPVWLVSGNNPSNTGAAPTAADITAKTAARLVGDGSTDVTVPGNEIIVPLQTIKPAGTTAQVDGAYAYWVGDEGVKAKINTSDPRFGLETTDQQLGRIQAPAVTVVNRLNGFANVPVTAALNDNMRKGLSDAQMSLVSTNISPAGLKNIFHDAGTYAYGIAANVREGGLKRDLNRALHDTPSPVSGAIFTDPGGRGAHWDVARSWAALRVNTGGGFPVAPLVQPHREANQGIGAAQHGVGPIISRWGIEWWVRIERVSGSAGQPGSTYTLGLGIRPVLQLTNPYNVRLPATVYRLSHNFGHDGSGGVRWQVGTKNMEFTWATLCSLPSSSPLLNGIGVSSGTRPWFHFLTPSVALEPGETAILMPDTANWTAAIRADAFNFLARVENSGGGVLRFPATPDVSRTVTWEELDAAHTNASSVMRFGENRGAGWNENTGRNYVVHLSVHDNKTPDALVSDIGEPLARIERIGFGKIDKPKNDIPNNNLRGWAVAGNSVGQTVQVFDSFLGNDLVSYSPASNRNTTWARNYNPRFNFPSMPNGTPRVNGAFENDARRNLSLWGLRYGHSGWHTRIDPMEFPPGSGSVFWGNATTPPLAQTRIVLYELPYGELLSPGQLQHVNLGGRDRPLRLNNRVVQNSDVNTSKLGQAAIIQPTYILGNSYRDPAVALGATDLSYDWSYLANREIWDRWFASGIPINFSGTGELPNPRMKSIAGTGASALAKLKNIDQAAANLLVDGMFNLNSTSVEAWKALFGSTANGRIVVAAPGGNSLTFDPVSENSAAPRFARTTVTNQTSPNADMFAFGGDARWSGPVVLSDDQLDDLARGIVQRIKDETKRNGRPFASLSDFINRPADKEMGILQETLDQKQLPTGTPGGTTLKGGRLNNNFLGQFANGTVEPEGAPGALRQGDLLQAVGSFINARSDTFRIRAYGEKRNGTTIVAQAWCEAVVQRVPDYLDPADKPETPVATLASPANKTFGRRYIIQSFRWLSPSEI